MSAVTDQEKYWDFTWADMAEDARASVKAMTKHNGAEKGFYVGWSQGTIQMTVALTKYEDELSNYLEKIVYFTPCTIGLGTSLEPDLSEQSMNLETKWLREELGIYAVPSPTWETDKVRMCEKGSAAVCDYYSTLGSLS